MLTGYWEAHRIIDPTGESGLKLNSQEPCPKPHLISTMVLSSAPMTVINQ